MLLLGCIWANNTYAQSPDCATATPFCDNILTPFPAGVNQPPAPIGNNYDCLGSQPNPAWYTMTIGVPGNIDFQLNNSANVDIDFILWGPFASTADALAQCGGLGNGGASGSVIDCSFSAAAIEDVLIPNAQVGEVYVLLITNFSNTPTNITSTSNVGTGSVVCDCQINNTYSLLPTPAINQGIMFDTSGYNATMIVCGPDPVSGSTSSLGFMLSTGGENTTDSLVLYGPNTDLGLVFPGSALFVSPASTPLYDSIDLLVLITPNATQKGSNPVTLSVLNYGVSACVQDFLIDVVVPGVEIEGDTFVCSQTVDTLSLNASTYMPAGFTGTETFNWSQLSGPPVTFSDPTLQSPQLYVPAASFGDVIVVTVDYSATIDAVNGTICGGSDTFSIQVGGGILTVAGDTSICAGASTIISAHYETFLAGGNGVCGINNVACGGASNVVTIGTGTNPSPSSTTDITPYQGFWHDGRMQMLFLASELTAMGIQPGLLSSLAFDVVQDNGQIYSSFTIKLECTSITSHPGLGFLNVPNVVFTAGTVNPSLGWNTYNFQNTYEWDGTSNLLVEVCFDNTQWNDGDPVNYSPTAFQSTYYEFTDFSTGCTMNLGFGNIETNRPNVRFGNCQLAPPVSFSWLPTAGIAPGQADDSTALVTPAVTTQYVVAGSDGTCTLRDTVTVTIQTALPAPIIVCDSVSIDYISFAWQILPGAASYEYSIDGGVTWIPIVINSADITGLAQGETVDILVRALTGTGACGIGAAGSHSCQTINCSFPAPVINCNPANNTVSSVTFNWASFSPATAYEYSTDGGVTWIATTDTFAVISGLDPSETVNIQVRGVNGNAVCNMGSIANSSCASLPCVFPAPTISCGTATVSSVTFNWTAVGLATSYEYSIDGGTTWIPVAGTSVVISGLTTGELVNIQVRGINSDPTCNVGIAGLGACTADACAFQFNLTSFNNTACNGAPSNGFIVVNVTGGAAPYVFELGGVLDTINSNSDTIFTGLAAMSDVVVGEELGTGCPGNAAFNIQDQTVSVDVTIQQTANIPCNGDEVAALQAVATVTGGTATYVWSTTETTDIISDLGIGTYSVIASVGDCADTATASVVAPFNPTLNASIEVAGQDSTSIFLGETIGIDAGANQSGVSYLWTVTPATPIATAADALTTTTPDAGGVFVYVITATADTCVVTDTVTLLVNAVSFNGMPDAFTPNGDLLNDTFGPVNLVGAEVLEFKVFNRFGHSVHNDPNTAWDGRYSKQDQPRDVYTYVFIYQFPGDAQPTTLRGQVMLLR